MQVTGIHLLSGTPRFSNVRAIALASSGDTEGAWRATLTGDIKTALQGVAGSFALGLTTVDGPTILAVDRFAVRSLCYRQVKGQLLFSSRADELVDEDNDIDPQAIFDYLYFHVIPSPRTIFKDVYRLPPGHFAVFENGRLAVAPYWIPTFEERGTGTSFHDLKTEFQAILQSAVNRELDEDKPACFLSGGTDSSTVAGMAALASGKTVHTYSIGFDAQGYDEMEFARIAAKHFKTEHHEYYVTPADLVRDIPRVAAYYDQPFGNSSALPAYCCAKVARSDGVRKLLAGDGGDELFGGNSRYAKQKLFAWYGHVPGFLQKSIVEPLLSTSAADAFALTRKARSYVEQARVPMPDRLQMYNLMTRLGPSEVLSPHLLSQINVARPLELQRLVWDAASDCSQLNRELAFDWRFTLGETDLPKVMGATGLAGLNVGFPMLDDDLLAFSLALPPSYKLKGFRLRWFFKEALRGFLPDAIIAKKKQGFGLPFGVWANGNPALKALATDSLHRLAKRGVVRVEFIQRLLSQRMAEHPGYYGEMVWILMMLEQWLQAKAPRFNLRT